MSLSIGPAQTTDYPLCAALFPLLVVPDPPPSAVQFESRMLPRVLVARDGDEGIGYAFWQVYGELAHVLNVVVAEAARGDAGRGHDHLVIVVERDRSTMELVQGAGGDLLYALLQMAGPIEAATGAV